MSASARRLGPHINAEQQAKANQDKESMEEVESLVIGFRLCDMEILGQVFAHVRYCDCGNSTLVLMEDGMKRHGCSSSLRLFCKNCGWKYHFWSSKKQGQSFEVNKRLVYSMRTLEKGHTGSRKFCALMNMPSPPVRKHTKGLQ